MTINTITERLRECYDAPDRLTGEFLQDRMEELEGWHKDAAVLARESEGNMQEGVERLVGTMTETEHRAAKRLLATVYPLVAGEGLKVYEKIAPPDHEVAREEVVGMTWPIFVRCLATYDGSSHLTTWLTLAAGTHFRGYLLRIRDRNDTERHFRARRGFYQLERKTLTEKGRMPTREEYEEVVRSANAGWADKDSVDEVIDYLTAEDRPKRFDRKLDEEEGNDLYTVTPAPDRGPEVHAKDVGERLAKRMGKEELWDQLTET